MLQLKLQEFEFIRNNTENIFFVGKSSQELLQAAKYTNDLTKRAAA
jgi:hypothetical protein